MLNPFSPKRSAPEMLGATQAEEDSERNSLASQSSSTTARVRLQEKFRKVATMYKDEGSPEEIEIRIKDITTDFMEQSVSYEDIEAADKAYGGFKKRNVRASTKFIMKSIYSHPFVCILQQYRSMTKRNPSVGDVFICPYRYKSSCCCAVLVKSYSDKVEVALAGQHTSSSGESSHTNDRGILSVERRSAVKRAVRASPLSVGSQVQANLENFSPCKHVPFNQRSQKAVDHLVWKERKQLMAEKVPGIGIHGTEGCMNSLIAESICLVKLLANHNDAADDFHMDEHQVVQFGYQFKHGVTFMTLTTQHLLNNTARSDNCDFGTQGHFDGAFNWCSKDFCFDFLQNEQHGCALQPCLHQHREFGIQGCPQQHL